MGRAEIALTAKNLIPASSAVVAAAKNKQYEKDNDNKCSVAHVALL